MYLTNHFEKENLTKIPRKRIAIQITVIMFNVRKSELAIIQDRRKMLIPTLIKAKEDGEKAYLSYGNFYINNKMFTTENVSSAGYN
jgi:hypothetical protein